MKELRLCKDIAPPYVLAQAVRMGIQATENRVYDICGKLDLSLSERLLVDSILNQAFKPLWESCTNASGTNAIEDATQLVQNYPLKS